MPTKTPTQFKYTSHANPVLMPLINKNGQPMPTDAAEVPLINIALDTSLYTQAPQKIVNKRKLLKSRRTFLMLPSGLTTPLLAMAALTIIIVFSLRPISSLGTKFNYAVNGQGQNSGFVASVSNAVQGVVNYIESFFQGNQKDLIYVKPATDGNTQ